MSRALILVLVASSVAGLDGQRSREPGVELETIVTPMPTPPTLDAMWRSSDCVVRGNVGGTSFRLLTSPPRRNGRVPAELVVTDHVFTVTEVLKLAKNCGPPGAQIRISQLGGKVQLRDGRKLETIGASQGLRGEIVVFLRFWPSAESYALTSSTIGSIRLTAAEAQIPEKARGFVEFRNRPAVGRQELLSTLRGKNGLRP